MSFDEVELPLRVNFGSQGGPAFSTEVIVIDGGFERRNQNWSQARQSYDARAGVRSAGDAAALLNFFHARAGRARGFRLLDWSDYSSAIDGTSAPLWSDQNIAIGDGTTVLFQLVKNYTSGAVTHTRTIAYLLKVTRADGVVKGFTTCDQDLTLGGVTYQADGAMTPSASDLTINWKRRARLNADWVDYIDVPLDEPVELYNVNILNGTSAVRTFSSVTSPSILYAGTSQSADWGTAIPSSFSVQIQQVSSRFGPGNSAFASV